MYKLYRNAYSKLYKLFLSCVLVLLSTNAFAQTTYLVNSTADTPDADLSDTICADSNGDCTLRAAIENANKNSAKDKIHFNISGTGPHTIHLLQNLPTIMEAIELDATTQPGYQVGAPLIVLEGTLIPLVPNDSPVDQLPNGFLLDGNSAGSLIKGFVIGGFGKGDGNVDESTIGEISSGTAIRSNTSHNIIQANFIGLAADGITPFNNVWGVMVNGSHVEVGGENPEDRNIISGSWRVGVHISGSNSLIRGNYVGTSADGTSAIRNLAGINVTFPAFANRIESNVVCGNTQGIHVFGNDNTVISNFVGIHPTESSQIPNEFGVLIGSSRNIVGAKGMGNVISGNHIGIVFTDRSPTSENTVAANMIGTDKSGQFAIPNSIGIKASSSNMKYNLIGGNTPGDGNLISGNLEYGIWLRDGANNNTLQGNKIGTKIDGTTPLPNNGDGIYIEHAVNNIIGGAGTGEANTIAFNSGNGILIQDPDKEHWRLVSARNRISGNHIFENARLGIDLGGDGITPNDRDDTDDGPNRLQNFPEISKDPTSNGADLNLSYIVPSNSKHSAYPIRVEFYVADNNSQGKVFLYADTYTEAEAKGRGAKARTLAIKNIILTPGARIVATATDAENNTSEFSAAVAVLMTGECTSPVAYYADADGDSYGVDESSTNIVSCQNPGAGYATRAGDCDDTDATINPGATEIPGDGIDQNCDGIDDAPACLGTNTLAISELCSDNPATERRWLIHNPASCGVAVRWEVQKASGGGPVMVPSNGSVEISTGAASKGPTKVTFYWNNSSGIETKTMLTSSGSQCTSSATLSSALLSTEVQMGMPLQVYPNPMSGDGLWLEFAPEDKNVAYQGYVYDLSGRIMAGTQFEIGNAKTKYHWDLDDSAWSTGVYFLIIKSDEHTYRFKIMK